MATYYVDSNAGSTPHDGSDWDHAYLSFFDAIAGSLSAGDTILAASNHSKDYGGATTLNFPARIKIVSVDTSTNKYKAGATEKCTTGTSFDIKSGGERLSCAGVFLECSYSTTGSIKFNSYGGVYCFFGGGLKFSYRVEGQTSKCVAINSQIDMCNSTSAQFYAIEIDLRGCTFVNVGTSGVLTYRCYGISIVTDSDLTSFDKLITDYSTPHEMIIRRCRLKSGVTPVSSVMYQGSSFTIEYCSESEISATPLPLYLHAVYGGNCLSTSSVWRDNGGFDGENDYSYQLTAGTNCNRWNPTYCPHSFQKRHDASAPKTLTVYLASDDSGLLTDEVWIEVTYGDDATTTYTTGEYINTLPPYGYAVGVEAPGNFTTNYGSDPNQLNQTAHGYSDGTPLRLTTSVTLPGGLSATTTYYVVNSATDTYEVATTPGGTPVTLTSDGSGTHTAQPIFRAGTVGDWNGSGPGTAYEFVITGIAPQEPCVLSVKVFFAGPSTYRLWACPAITLT